MIDWHAKLVEFKAMADEMEMWVPRTEGHVRSMLGRNADELRRFIQQVQLELIPPEERPVPEAPPDWVMDAPARVEQEELENEMPAFSDSPDMDDFPQEES